MSAAARAGVVLALLAVVGAGAGEARASFLLTQGGRPVILQADRSGTAWVRFVRGGATRDTTLSGAVNGTPAFRVTYRKPTLRNACGPYAGPPLPYVVLACTMPDGSHWAVQVWQRLKLNFGGGGGTPEIHVSHWTGALPVLDLRTDWAGPGRFERLHGSFRYRGQGVFGRRTDAAGNPLDRFGRNIYLDSLAPADYTPRRTGWVRVNGILAQKPKGAFCYSLSPKTGAVLPPEYDGNRNVDATGRSSRGRYRGSVSGPGVTPIVVGTASSPAPYDPAVEAEVDAAQLPLYGPNSECRRGLMG